MAKLLDKAITETDLEEYLSSYSDFSFEISVLKLLRDNQVQCEHGGHYTDPVTRKSREFDIRAKHAIDNLTLRLAVECKNIRENYPVLVSMLPRVSEESYHQILRLADPVQETGPFGLSRAASPFNSRAKSVKVRGARSRYSLGRYVGKSIAQVGRTNDQSISSGDSEIYEKWGQALSSIDDLIGEMIDDGKDSDRQYFSMCLPVLVVPDGRLWAVDYDLDGHLTNSPVRIEHCSFYVGKSYSTGHFGPGYTVSHLELFTFSGLQHFIHTHLSSREGLMPLFMKDAS